MADIASSPDQTADWLEGLSDDVRACVLVDGDGKLAAVDARHSGAGEQLAAMTLELLETAGTNQAEVSTGSAVVYALRANGWTVGVVAGRFALSSLVFFDMRKALEAIAR
jgi:hypothetical protein